MSKKKIIFLGFTTIIAIVGLYTMVVEPNNIEVNEVEISDTGVEMRIGLIADFQRKNDDPSFVQRVVDIMNAKDLDTIIIAGDFIDKSLDELPSLEPLQELKTKHGVYGVLGNHDYNVYSHARYNANLEKGEKVKQYVESGNTIRILRNENIKIENVTIIGLDSYWAGLRDIDKALVNTLDGFRILFTHNQDGLEIDKEIADLYLFGHTHCGQVRLPYFGSVPKMMGFQGDYDYKHYVVDDANVYTTCGLTPGPRFLAPPEITIINLS